MTEEGSGISSIRRVPQDAGASPAPAFHIIKDVSPLPEVRAQGFLRRMDSFFLTLNRLVKAGLPDALNPFVQMGAVINVTFFIALVSGILLLFWYSPSVNLAWQSLEAMKNSPLAQLMRSLHRYSSDACMLFAVLHGVQTLTSRKFSGPRWLAWVSGLLLIGLMWFDGWLGYWLVWDQEARYVALATTKVLDVLPIFAEPMSRSFLTNESLNSLFFFIVFFVHMLIPLAFGVGLWLHLMRINKSVFFTTKPLTIAITVALVLVSILVPAVSGEPADMLALPDSMSADWFYLMPIGIADRLSAGALWLLGLVVTAIVFSVPWTMVRRNKEPAEVNEKRCNGCTQCFQDCPYNAITMMPREGRSPLVSRIDAAKCVACGVCTGSCDSVSIRLPELPAEDVRTWLNARLERASSEGEKPWVAFVCAESAGADLRVNPDDTCDELPGYLVRPVPCVGWLHPLLIERAIRRGAAGAVLVGCGPDPVCRLGTLWTEQRLEGEREPELRKEKVADSSIHYFNFNRSEKRAFLYAARAVVSGQEVTHRPPGRLSRWLVTAALVLGLGAVIVGLSETPYPIVTHEKAELVVSFKHAGRVVEKTRNTVADQKDLLPHMRRARAMERIRLPVRLQVFIDGKKLVDRSYEPGGLFKDGQSIAIEKLVLDEGEHTVSIRLDDSADPNVWNWQETRTLTFEKNRRRVILFDKVHGFQWY